jgi:hypothetical protein
MSHEHISQDCHVCAEALAQKLDKALAEAERLKALMTRCEGCASETAIGGGPPQYCYACWNMKERDVEHAELQVSALREALAFCVDEYGCSYSAQGEYDGCETNYGKRKCAICRAREMLHKDSPPVENRYREPKGKDILGSLPDLPEPRYCVKCGARQKLGDAAHAFICTGTKGDAAHPAPFIEDSTEKRIDLPECVSCKSMGKLCGYHEPKRRNHEDHAWGVCDEKTCPECIAYRAAHHGLTGE